MERSDRTEKIQEVMDLASSDDRVLGAVLQYVRSATCSREDKLEELRKKIELADDRLLDVALNYSRSSV